MDTTKSVNYTSTGVKKSKGILTLLDDCLEHIFKWLPTSDLCSVYETCTRFKDITENYYKTYRSKTEKVRIPVENEVQEKIVKYFGLYTRKIIIRYENSEAVNKQIANVIKRSKKKISYLELIYAGVMSVPFQTVENILIDLKEIILREVILGEELISCRNLKYLYLRKCSMHVNELWMKHNYPKLRTLWIDHCVPAARETFKEFLVQNPNIDHFTYRPGKFESESREWIPEDIMNDVKNIREINFSHRAVLITRDLMILSKCETLKNLQLSVVHDEKTDNMLCSFFYSLANRNSLEGLVYSGDLSIELCVAMSKLTNLKVLGLYMDGLDICENGCEILSKAFINLERLYIDNFHPQIKHHLYFVENCTKLKKMFLLTKFCVGHYTSTLERAILKRKKTSEEWPLVMYANKSLAAANIVEIFYVNSNSDRKGRMIMPFEYELNDMFSRTFFCGHLVS